MVSYTEFSRQYPFMTKMLVKMAADRLAETTEYLESQARHAIAQIQYEFKDDFSDEHSFEFYKNEQKLYVNHIGGSITLVDRITSSWSGTDKKQRLINWANNKYSKEDLKFFRAKEEVERLKQSLKIIKVTNIGVKPDTADIEQAHREVKEYIEALQNPTVSLLNAFGNKISNAEKHHLQMLREGLFGNKIRDIKFSDKLSTWYGEGAYSVLVEPTLFSKYTADGQLIYTITKNSYGVNVINTQNILFADIDCFNYNLDYHDDCSLKSLPWGLTEKELTNEKLLEINNNIHKVAHDNDLSFRIYRTRNGFRLLESSRLWEPSSKETQTILEQLGSDRLFNALCYTQRCFRARSQPKPWRYGDLTENYMDDESTAVCSYISTAGKDISINPIAAEVISAHDSLTKAFHEEVDLA